MLVSYRTALYLPWGTVYLQCVMPVYAELTDIDRYRTQLHLRGTATGCRSSDYEQVCHVVRHVVDHRGLSVDVGVHCEYL